MRLPLLLHRRSNAVDVFGGRVARLRNDPHWDGSPFEAADIRWDGDDGLQTISLFETRDEVPEVPEVPDKVLDTALEKVEALMKKKEFEAFVEAVPSELPALFLYDAVVPVRMELRLVRDRLKNGWREECCVRSRYYRSITAVKGDLRLIAANCLKYNEANSPLAAEAKALEAEVDRLFEEKEEEVALPAGKESEIGEEVEGILGALRNLLEPVASVLETPLPPYLVSYSSLLYVCCSVPVLPLTSPSVNCVHPITWSDVALKTHHHLYFTFSAFYHDCRSLLATLRALHATAMAALPSAEQQVRDLFAGRGVDLWWSS